MKGKWYLCYLVFDALENHISNAVIEKKVTLKSVEENDAVKEALDLWKQKLSNGTYKGWDKNTYPKSPRVIYEILLNKKE